MEDIADYRAYPINYLVPIDVWLALLCVSDDGFLEWFGGYLDSNFGWFSTRNLCGREWRVVGWRRLECIYPPDDTVDASNRRNWRETPRLYVGTPKKLSALGR